MLEKYNLTENKWLKEKFEEVVALLQVVDFEDLESILNRFAWADGLVVDIMRGVWTDVGGLQSVMELEELDDDSDEL